MNPDLLHVLEYLGIGCTISGIATPILQRNYEDTPIEICYLITLVWPLFILAIPITLTHLISKLTYKIVYSKKDRIENVTKTLKGY